MQVWRPRKGSLIASQVPRRHEMFIGQIFWLKKKKKKQIRKKFNLI